MPVCECTNLVELQTMMMQFSMLNKSQPVAAAIRPVGRQALLRSSTVKKMDRNTRTIILVTSDSIARLLFSSSSFSLADHSSNPFFHPLSRKRTHFLHDKEELQTKRRRKKRIGQIIFKTFFGSNLQ